LSQYGTDLASFPAARQFFEKLHPLLEGIVIEVKEVFDSRPRIAFGWFLQVAHERVNNVLQVKICIMLFTIQRNFAAMG